MLYKYINENTVMPFTGRILRVSGRIYANPSESTLKKNGYKELVTGEPLEEKEGYYTITTYMEDDNYIYEKVEYQSIDNETETETV